MSIDKLIDSLKETKDSCPDDNSFGSAQRLGMQVCIEAIEFELPAIRELVEAVKLAVADAEKAVNPKSRLYEYTRIKAALKLLEG